MPGFQERLDALETLQGARDKHEVQQERRAELATYAADVLSRKGSKLIAQSGHYGGSRGLIGSSNPGVLLGQATPFVSQGKTNLALRHVPNEKHRHSIELMFSSTDDIKQLLTQRPGSDVLATFHGGTTDIDKVENPELFQLDALEIVLQTIDAELPGIEAPRSDLPQIDTYGRLGISTGVHDIEVLPKFRVKTNFSS